MWTSHSIPEFYGPEFTVLKLKKNKLLKKRDNNNNKPSSKSVLQQFILLDKHK